MLPSNNWSYSCYCRLCRWIIKLSTLKLVFSISFITYICKLMYSNVCTTCHVLHSTVSVCIFHTHYITYIKFHRTIVVNASGRLFWSRKNQRMLSRWWVSGWVGEWVSGWDKDKERKYEMKYEMKIEISKKYFEHKISWVTAKKKRTKSTSTTNRVDQSQSQQTLKRSLPDSYILDQSCHHDRWHECHRCQHHVIGFSCVGSCAIPLLQCIGSFPLFFELLQQLGVCFFLDQFTTDKFFCRSISHHKHAIDLGSCPMLNGTWTVYWSLRT